MEVPTGESRARRDDPRLSLPAPPATPATPMTPMTPKVAKVEEDLYGNIGGDEARIGRFSATNDGERHENDGNRGEILRNRPIFMRRSAGNV